MNIIIAGSRKFKDYNFLASKVDEIITEIFNHSFGSLVLADITIISGNAEGADKLGERYAKENKLRLKIVPAKWQDMSEPCSRKVNKFGKPYNALAGIKRNREMANAGDILILFWDGNSPGSKNMKGVAEELDLVVYDIRVAIT